VAQGGELLLLHMLSEKERSTGTWQHRHPEAIADPTAPPLPEVRRQLLEYLAGDRRTFDLPLAPRGTPFQLSVWEELARIPYGVTMSYGEVAAALGKSLLASRAVGLANGRNPISIILPCHRVIGADGSLTGYGWGLDRKEWLLRHEGVLGAWDAADDSAAAQPTLW
jgi:methylated-DNA-[protein]-cysteine S-methyltransferase